MIVPVVNSAGLSTEDFNRIFTKDKEIIFNFHGYPWLIHKLTYKRDNQHRFHIHGYREKGNICTALELAVINEIDRFSLVIDVIKRVGELGVKGSIVREKMMNEKAEVISHAHEFGTDREEDSNWIWPF